jgi:hypothetical protein
LAPTSDYMHIKTRIMVPQFFAFTRRARYHWRELRPSNLRLPTLECYCPLCGLDCDLWGATTLLFSYKCVHHYVGFASFPLVSKACLCVLLSLSFLSSPLKTRKDSCKSLHLCFSWIKVVFLSPIFMISQGWYRYRQQILCCWRNPCMSLIVVLVKLLFLQRHVFAACLMVNWELSTLQLNLSSCSNNHWSLLYWSELSVKLVLQL